MFQNRCATAAAVVFAAAASVATSQYVWSHGDASPDAQITLTASQPSASYEIIVASNAHDGLLDWANFEIALNLSARRDSGDDDLDTADVRFNETGFPADDSGIEVLTTIERVETSGWTEDVLGLRYDQPARSFWLRQEISHSDPEIYEVYHLTLALDEATEGSVTGTAYAQAEFWSESTPPSDLELTITMTPMEE